MPDDPEKTLPRVNLGGYGTWGAKEETRNRGVSRRQFLKGVAATATGAAIVGTGLWAIAERSPKTQETKKIRLSEVPQSLVDSLENGFNESLSEDSKLDIQELIGDQNYTDENIIQMISSPGDGTIELRMPGTPKNVQPLLELRRDDIGGDQTEVTYLGFYPNYPAEIEKDLQVEANKDEIDINWYNEFTNFLLDKKEDNRNYAEELFLKFKHPPLKSGRVNAPNTSSSAGIRSGVVGGENAQPDRLLYYQINADGEVTLGILHKKSI